jgi:hypothetical protein
MPPKKTLGKDEQGVLDWAADPLNVQRKKDDKRKRNENPLNVLPPLGSPLGEGN